MKRPSPAHIASLAPPLIPPQRGGGKGLRFAKGAYTSPFASATCHSQHTARHSERPPVIPKRSEESPPFAKRKGARGMPYGVVKSTDAISVMQEESLYAL